MPFGSDSISPLRRPVHFWVERPSSPSSVHDGILLAGDCCKSLRQDRTSRRPRNRIHVPMAAEAEIQYADALKAHIVAAVDEILGSKPDDPFKALQKVLFQASLGDGMPPPIAAIALKWLSADADAKEYVAKFDLQTHIEAVVALKGKGSGPVSGIKFMISDAGDYFTDLSKKLKAGGGKAMTAEELKAMDAAAAKAKREKEAKEQAERDLKDAENAKKTAEMEAQGKKVTGGLHKFDASEVDVNGGDATADDFMDAFGF